MIFPNIDELFMEEMNNHNNVIAMTGDLQQALTTVSKFGLDITTFVSSILDCIQRKEYDNAAKILTDAVYSIDQLATELGNISNSIQQGVLRVYEQKGEGF